MGEGEVMRKIGEVVEAIIVGGIIAGVVAVFVMMGVSVYDKIGAEKYYLKKTAWECSKTETRKQRMPLPIGKVIIPHDVDNEVCVEYRMTK